ncbi:bifunctional lysylphosphatidylglycerol synthetase/lysine--tRNA ligase LysX [Varibaculum cambriense]|uniref:Bifunctional lysylphosphatidylglycerol synthetase/lysine--tRNA ligase LysX n=1 Tax=Varibaculum cambriense TaxID=184870 RepID=A0ABX4USQ9_9ACTO|nr:bifunctional lysylphosphatidylglycerol synthetase/lysine--tRNA ligase LysX [Varibaculum cambriense]MBS5944302.1 bifunctional lysylphosphatidylglycerol synthetase/lysine--tRNA ligase LysX [Varibaculum cambriense]MDU7407861.1 bifunctional lysylphosphatidylglycerol synthetase/lysine--tRNA ligase LysX [Varibaculum cambriense]PMB89032.1 bifunctional lysylphosphatidylglycerol synthetase/lysine--tRNA ligase LysX [Varibaculum cambriense]
MRVAGKEKSHSSWRQRVPAWMGWIYTIAALFCLVMIPFRYAVGHHIGRFTYLVLTVLGVPSTATLGTAVLLAFLALLCFSRKRIGAIVLIALQALHGLLCLVALIFSFSNPDFDLTDLIILGTRLAIAALILAVLFASARSFWGKINAQSAWKALVILISGQLLVFGIGFAMARVIAPRSWASSPLALWVYARMSGLRLHRGFNIHFMFAHQAGFRALSFFIMVLSGLVVMIAANRFILGQRVKARTRSEDLALRSLLIKWGKADSLSYYATRDNRAVVFSADGQAVVSYGVALGVALAAGDPIGDPSSWENAVQRWKSYCYRQGWIPAVISASAQGARIYRHQGLRVRKMGDEAIISPERFERNSSAGRALLAAQRRVARAGVEIEICRQSELSPAQLREVAMVAELFRRGNERGFSMSLDRMFAPQEGEQLIVTARGKDGQLQCLLTFVPWGQRAVSLNLMRRAENAVNGVVEAMVLTLLQQGPEKGVERFSLNFAMFREIFVEGEAVDATINDRVKRALFVKASRFWQLESLYESNARYNPKWLPRYFCFSSDPLVPLSLLAAGMLEGFVPAPEAALRGEPFEWEVDSQYLSELEAMRSEYTAAKLQVKLSEQQRSRRAKAEKLSAAGIESFPAGFDLGIPLSQAKACLDAGENGKTLRTLGRIVARRNHGGVVFWDLYYQGTYLQVVLERGNLSPEQFAHLRLLDLGDLLVVNGKCGASRTGTPSLIAESWTLAAKALRPIPHPAARLDSTTRTRERTMTLLNDAAAMRRLQARSRALSAVRKELIDRGYLEVETPMLQAVQGGANARPFVTHSNAYQVNMFLRIAPELYLKRLAIAGMGAIFEMGRSFRNEGADATHNPEFTSLEVYKAGSDYREMMTLTRELYQAAARAIHGKEIALRPVNPEAAGAGSSDADFEEVDISGQWRVISVFDAVSQAVGTTVTPDTGEDDLRSLCAQHHLTPPPGANCGTLLGTLYDELVEARTVKPTFYCDFPVESSPLTRRHRSDPRLAERWDLVAFGMELGTAYSELTDPRDQRERFTQQSLAAAAGDPEAMSLDEDFLNCLELGMTPLGGLGLGMDRMAMMLMGCDIRQVLAFPFVKPRN